MGKVLFPELVGEMAKRGDTQKTLAQVLGLSRMTMYNKFSGKKEWKISEIEAICDYYKRDFHELFKRNEDKK